MQTIPATGVAMGMKYKEIQGIEDQAAKDSPFDDTRDLNPITVCSLGDASVTEGEIAEAFQMAALKQLPILYLVQDNGWDISANAAKKPEHKMQQNTQKVSKDWMPVSIDGANFIESYEALRKSHQNHS